MKRLAVKLFVFASLAVAAFTMSVHTNEKTAQAATKGQKVVKYAKRFVGNKYRYGGTSLTRGTDCSGFTMSVYRKFGKRLPHSSSAQRRVGRKVKGGIKNARPGDLICYSGHVAIYMGKNKIVHASNSAPYPRGGIKISNNARYRRIVAVRRLV
jgi:cell wall-associated NlpC family hydrolase